MYTHTENSAVPTMEALYLHSPNHGTLCLFSQQSRFISIYSPIYAAGLVVLDLTLCGWLSVCVRPRQTMRDEVTKKNLNSWPLHPSQTQTHSDKQQFDAHVLDALRRMLNMYIYTKSHTILFCVCFRAQRRNNTIRMNFVVAPSAALWICARIYRWIL